MGAIFSQGPDGSQPRWHVKVDGTRVHRLHVHQKPIINQSINRLCVSCVLGDRAGMSARDIGIPAGTDAN